MHGTRLSARFRHLGGAEAARAAVAAGLTWQTCTALLHTSAPYAGAVAAVLIVETTVVGTAGAALRYAAGCLLGVLVAVPGALYVEPATAGLGLVAFASVLLARQGFLGHYGLHVPTTALLTYAMVRGRHSGEVVSHLAEIVLGIAFGLACGALLFPAVRVRSAERALDDLRLLTARSLDGLAAAVARHERPRDLLGPTWQDDLDRALERARGAVEEAHESLRWNVRPTARRRRWHLDRRVLRTLTEVAHRAAATGRLLDAHPAATTGETAPSAPAAGESAPGAGTPRTEPYPRLLRTAALCVYSCRGGRPHPALPAARHALARLDTADGGPPAGTAGDPRLLEHLGAVLDRLAAPAPAPPARPHHPSARHRLSPRR
ncbi:FUSC family protein [Streptomyces sp. LP11]|uniref:FUSC family protein n=1 Tax=Streptomyces pyxinicus TaxID=2970331 RepID=A0ABT2B8N8_9ACTN|nr:FUSC family protein [Streptomyces sp. LP11]MCS0604879.1 FUSC family protein [Streptomyces sp. LP11]